MHLPVPNINGTNREDLLKDHIQAMHALRNAISHVSAIAPHGRDYQTVAEPGALYAAQREHADRLKMLRVVLAEIETIAEALV